MADVDPKVREAVRKAGPAKFNYAAFIIRAVLFHMYFIPTTLILFPFLILKALLGIGRYRTWTTVETVGVWFTKRAIRNLVRFQMQPIPARENGLREMNNLLGTLLAILNFGGPGGYVIADVKPQTKLLDVSYNRIGRKDADWFDPMPLEAFKGILTINTGSNRVTDSARYDGPALVDPKWANTRIKGYWYMRNNTEVPTPRAYGTQPRPVMLYFHGGACIAFGAGDPFMSLSLSRTAARSGNVDLFSVDYHLAPTSPFPVQITQALAGYFHLIDGYGYKPDQIFIGGDSYGAWLALQMEHYLRSDGSFITERWAKDKAPTKSGVPGLCLFSPWLFAYDIDTLGRSKGGLGDTYDIIEPALGHAGVDGLQVGPNHKKRCPLAVDTPWISPGTYPKEDLAILPPMFVVIAELEALYDEDAMFVKNVKEAGGNVELYIGKGLVHDYGAMVTFNKQFRHTCERMRVWLSKQKAFASQ